MLLRSYTTLIAALPPSRTALVVCCLPREQGSSQGQGQQPAVLVLMWVAVVIIQDLLLLAGVPSSMLAGWSQ